VEEEKEETGEANERNHLFGYRTKSCPRPTPPTINPANVSLAVGAASRMTRLGSVICLQAAELRTIKLSANGGRACVRHADEERDREQAGTAKQRGAFSCTRDRITR